uniref:Uncharacterized protein n=1 Tax=Megaselia scalaris TaxID=36166 RepID=T1H4C2_MEGSC
MKLSPSVDHSLMLLMMDKPTPSTMLLTRTDSNHKEPICQLPQKLKNLGPDYVLLSCQEKETYWTMWQPSVLRTLKGLKA